jgi:NGP1NT (NUC091) domain
VHIVETESYNSTFGPKATRKRPRLNGAASLSDLAGAAATNDEQFEEKKQEETTGEGIDWIQAAREAVFSKGQSKRIWNELYKVPLPFKIKVTSGYRFFRYCNQCSGCERSHGNTLSSRRTVSEERSPA